VFPVRYELNLHIVFRRNSVFKGLRRHVVPTCQLPLTGLHNVISQKVQIFIVEPLF
jgi:hypothetical protein